MATVQDAAARVENIGYQVNSVTYLPHYRNENLFVGPGYPRHSNTVYTVEQLLKAGANRISLLLWTRGKTGVVNKSNL